MLFPFPAGLLGWRYPFIIMGIYTMFAAIIVNITLREPQRGGKEEDLTEVLSRGYTLPPLTVATFCYSMSIPTVAIMLVQTIPNTVPW